MGDSRAIVVVVECRNLEGKLRFREAVGIVEGVVRFRVGFFFRFSFIKSSKGF